VFNGHADGSRHRIRDDVDPLMPTTRLLWLRLAGLLLLVASLAVVTVVWGASSIRNAIDDVAAAGWPGIVAFVALYALATVLLVPGSAATATAGVAYGTLLGAGVAVVGATVGSTIAYAIARGAGRRPAEALFSARVATIESWVAQRQFRSIVALRLMPIVPFNVFNYAAGLSPVRPRPYVAGTVVGLVPGALLVAALGSSARQPTSPAFVASLVVVALAALASALAARRWSRR
jgi:uncharacterized membrane protein YdjX (TVP38/TMEM64 family)